MDIGKQKIIQEDILDKIPKPVKEVMKTLNDAGYQSYLVGGAVRDMVMGVEPKDWDVTTDAHWSETVKIFHHNKIVSKELSVIKIFNDRADELANTIDVATLRKEVYIYSSGKPDVIQFTKNIHEDLPRRDFTINAMAMDLTGNIIDDFHGEKDAKEKNLRFIGDGKKRILEDPVRMLRGLRMVAEKGMTIDEETFSAMTENATLIGAVSGERIGQELKGIFQGDFREYGVTTLLKTGLFKEIFAAGIGENPEKSNCLGLAEQYEQLDLLGDIDKIIRCTRGEFEAWQVLLGWFLIKNMRTLQIRPADFKSNIMRFSWEKKFSDAIITAYENIEKVTSIKDNVEEIKYFIKGLVRKIGEVNYRFMETVLSVEPGEIGSDAIDRLQIFQKILDDNEPIYIKDLMVTGRDIQEELNICGREIGAILEYLLELVHKNPQLNEKSQLLEQAKGKQEI